MKSYRPLPPELISEMHKCLPIKEQVELIGNVPSRVIVLNNCPRVRRTLKFIHKKVPCETKDGDELFVPVSLLHQSKKFKAKWEDLKIATIEQLEDFNFPVKAISTSIFKKVVDWMGEHIGKPEPVIEEDPVTLERIWFTLTEWETNFFKVDTQELVQMLEAADFLEIPSLYLFGCQSMAALMKNKTAEEIRELFGLPDDLTEEEKNEIRKQNIWCHY